MLITSAASVATDEQAEVAVGLRMAIAALSRRLRQTLDGGLSPSASLMLATIQSHGPLTPSALAQTSRMARPTASRLIAKLHRAGFIVMEPDPSDRRSYEVRVSERGSTLLEDRRARKTASLALALGRLTPQELETLRRATALLERLVDDV
jgi:DNA-binding MarR family transcriptional regulator